MKLAFCLYNYFPYGGLQRDFLRIAKECVRRGHSVDVYTMRWDGDRDADLSVTIIPTTAWQNHTRARQFIELLKPHLVQYELVVGFNKMPGLDVYYAADTCYQAKADKKQGLVYRLTSRYRHLVNYENSVFNPDAKTEILLISPLQQADFVKYYQTLASRFHILPPGITKDRNAPDNAATIRAQTRKEFNISENDFLLLMVGSGFKTKGLDRILIGFSALSEDIRKRSHLYIVGKDNPSTFQKQAKQLGIAEQVHFLGGRDDIPQLLLAADLLLHPAYNENTGTVLLEALVSGLPVLTTDVCGYAHYIQKADAGIVLPSPFQQQLFNTTIQNMLLSSRRTQWHENGLLFAKQADLYSMPQRAVDVIESLRSSAKVVPAFAGMTMTVNDGQQILSLKPSLKRYFASQINLFDQMMALRGETFRALENRRTQRISLGNKNYFIKQHFGIGWKEIFKNLFQFRLPITSAKNEWLAIQRIHSLGISGQKIVGYGSRGYNPAHIESFLMTEELPGNISLEDFCKVWKIQPPPFTLKQQLIREVARIARILHTNGINHRDFYLCHFLLENHSSFSTNGIEGRALFLIDLHRAHIRKRTPERWIVKDLAGLFFSSKNIGLTRRDFLRFMKEYRNKSIRDVLNRESAFWQKVTQRGDKLYQQHAN